MTRKFYVLLWLVLSIAPFNSVFGQVIINEYSCSNITGPSDAYGQKEDWIELLNVTAAPIDLTGWYLSKPLVRSQPSITINEICTSQLNPHIYVFFLESLSLCLF